MPTTVKFQFACGDFVRTDTGELGPIIILGYDDGINVYFVDLRYGRLWFKESRLTLTDDRPCSEAGWRLVQLPLAKTPADT